MINRLPYPYAIIEGNIGSGKTSLVNAFAKGYDCDILLENFDENPFLETFYENPARYALPVELFFMSERHQHLSTELIQRSLFSKPKLADYSFVKTWLFGRVTLKAHELDLFKRLFQQLNASIPLPSKQLYLKRPMECLIHNIKKRNRSFEQNISTDYLKSVDQTYLQYFASEKRFPIVVIELGDLDFLSEPSLQKKIQTIFESKHSNGLHYESLI